MTADTPAPGTYQHYKGGLYEVLGVADEPESGKQFVVYQSLGVLVNQLPPDPKNNFYPEPGATGTSNKGELTVCAVARFTEEVDGKEYSGGKRVPRFRLLAPVPRRR
jgi:hypothetical protein